MRSLIVFLAVGLVGCTQSIDEMSYSQRQSYVAGMVEKCRAQGVPEDEIEACTQQEVGADQARRARQKQVGAAIAGASQSYGRSMQQANRSVTCTSTPSSSWVGGTPSSVRTTCY
jgi:hypothetical protein